MSTPHPKPGAQFTGPKALTRPSPATDKRALQPYLKVQIANDRQMIRLLRGTLSSVNKELSRLRGRSGIGVAIRAEQLQASKTAIFQEMAKLWREIGDRVRAGRYEAAAAAADSINIYDKMLFAAVGAGHRADAILDGLRAYARNAIDLGRTRLETSAVELSRNVYRAESLSTGQLDSLLNGLLARGSSAREISREVREFIDPDVAGGVSYSAMRLGRTELNNAFHASQVQVMGAQPWVRKVKWNLSGSHGAPDACDDIAYNGDGEYSAGDVPAKPHPQCLCFLTPVLVSQADFLSNLENGSYDDFLDMMDG